MVQVPLTHPPGQDVDSVFTDGPGGAESCDRGAAGRRCRHPSDFLVVPIHYPCALQRPPAEAGDAQFDRRADGSFGRMYLEGLAHLNPALGNGRAAVGYQHLVHATVIFGNREVGRQTSARVDLGLGQRLGGVGEFLSAKMRVAFDHPATVHRAPEQRDFSIRWKAFCGRHDVGAGDRLPTLVVGQREKLRRGG